MRLLARRISIVPALAVTICLQASVEAQIFSGWIQGKVQDRATSAGLPDAAVDLQDPEGNTLLQSKTDPSGGFLFLGLPIGDYDLSVQKKGYSSYRIRSVRVRMGVASSVDFDMQENPSGPPLTLETAWEGNPSDPWASGSSFDQDRINSLPSARNIWTLIQNQDLTSVTDHID